MAQVPLADGRRLVLALDATLLRVGSVSVAALVLRDVSAERGRARSRAAQQARLQAVIGAAEGLALLIGADRRRSARDGRVWILGAAAGFDPGRRAGRAV
jgi:hypothetical protein